MLRQAIFVVAISLGMLPAFVQAETPTNLLIITVDDMNCDSVGVYGCALAGTTPNMDRFARTALRFDYAHVQVGNCMPSRNVMWSGRYPHNNGVEGFYQVKDASFPTLCTLAKEAGYFTAIRHKISHSTPYSPYAWDLELDVLPDGKPAHIKDAKSYGDSARRAISEAGQAGKPFCLLINISDPHKPFYSEVKNGPDPHVPSRVYEAAEVPVPGFLPDDPIIKQEVGLYYSSVRRADDAVGEVLQALEESGQTDQTFVMLLSDHGMPLPFAKTQLYHHSTRTPLMVRWPGVTMANSIDDRHMVSAVDFVPTLMDVVGAKTPDNIDGRSFAGILQGASQTGRDKVFKEYNENSGGKRNPMRAIETKEYLYIFNPWSDGQLPMATATNGTASYRRMKELAKTNPQVAERVELMDHRVVEELYHVASDHDCLHNLIDAPGQAAAAQDLRKLLMTHLVETNDPMAEVFRHRESPELLAAYMQKVQAEADARRANKKNANGKSAAKRVPAKLITGWTAEATDGGKKLVVSLDYKLPKRLGAQPLFLTLKDENQKRIERQERLITGTGTVVVTFAVAEGVEPNELNLAAFVGKDFRSSLQYLQGKVENLVNAGNR